MGEKRGKRGRRGWVDGGGVREEGEGMTRFRLGYCFWEVG